MTKYLIMFIVFMAIIAGVGVKSYSSGFDNGKAKQYKDDQAEIDAVNTKIETNKAIANAALKKFAEDSLQNRIDKENLTRQLEEQNAKSDHDAIVYSANLSSQRLHFKSTQTCGSGGSSDTTAGSGGQAAVPATPSDVELPAEISRSLRQLQLEGDLLIGSYKKCYDWANKPIKASK